MSVQHWILRKWDILHWLAYTVFISCNVLDTTSDIDECSGEQNNCSVNSTCTNTVGSYLCSCFSGYEDEGMGYVCTGMFRLLIFVMFIP